MELRAFGLDYQRWRVMAVLNEETDCSMRRLSDLSSVDRTTLTRTLNLMQEEGLVTRRLRASDRRSVSVSLSPHGRQLLKQILPIVLGQSERALAGFTAQEFDELRGQLTRIAENLKR
ncbi:MAG: MarR family transcriptional regulator [Hyphomicrobiales bacterium]|nr:MarR family transcriptional regulator [Hyphomicrobiales bacterium]